MSSIVRRIAAFGVAALLVGVVAVIGLPPPGSRPRSGSEQRAPPPSRTGAPTVVALRAQCDANLAAFELDVTGAAGRGHRRSLHGPGRRRDLRWRLASRQRRRRPRAPATFSSGRAQAFVFLGVFDQSAGDLEARDLGHRASVACRRLRRTSLASVGPRAVSGPPRSRASIPPSRSRTHR